MPLRSDLTRARPDRLISALTVAWACKGTIMLASSVRRASQAAVDCPLDAVRLRSAGTCMYTSSSLGIGGLGMTVSNW